VTTGKLVLQRQPVDVGAIVEQTLQLMAPALEEHKLELVWTSGPPLPVEGDRPRGAGSDPHPPGRRPVTAWQGGDFELHPPLSRPEDVVVSREHRESSAGSAT
jgi:hypothetical protein